MKCKQCECHKIQEWLDSERRASAVKAFLEPPAETPTSAGASIRRVDRFKAFWKGEKERQPVENLDPRYTKKQ